MRRILRPGGVCLVNVPSWRGKWFLELSAFRLGLSPADEMNDHKTYYDPRDLWPMLVRAGFRPQDIQVPPPQVRPQHVRGLPRAAGHRMRDDHDHVHRDLPRRDPARSSTRSTSPASRRSPRPRRGAGPGRPAVHPGRGRIRRARRPRGQRLPQAVRVRGLRPDRQRVRAHRPRQRRGLGHGVLGLARGLAPRRRRRPADLLGRRRRPRAQRVAQHRAGRRAGAEGRRRRPRHRRAATAATPRRPPRRAS